MDERLSRKMSYLLRHGAVKHSLHMSPDGYVPMRQMFGHLPQGTSQEDVARVVANCAKQRFKLRDIDGATHIRANQGHTVNTVGDAMHVRIHDPSELPVAVHGTSLRSWDVIKEAGLNRMQRVRDRAVRLTVGRCTFTWRPAIPER